MAFECYYGPSRGGFVDADSHLSAKLCLSLGLFGRLAKEGCFMDVVVMIVVSALRIDPRVEKEARALAAAESLQ